MNTEQIVQAFREVKTGLEGDIFFEDTVPDRTVLMAYATDASVYQEHPMGVALPKNKADICRLVKLSKTYNIPLIPRTAGTSLAGQVVGNGLVVDVSRYMNRILEVNTAEKWVRVEPGLERDVLNELLLPHGLFFGPETSTSNRAMIGGMIGNNSCGLHSMVWGTTRDNLLSVNVVLGNGNEAVFADVDEHSLQEKLALEGFEGSIYRSLHALLSDKDNQQAIEDGYPAKSLRRRNTGYALDALVNTTPYLGGFVPFNLSHLIAGSEGTLAFITEAKLRLMELPPKVNGLVCVHCTSLKESLQVNLIAVRHPVTASELVDDVIMNFTKDHPEHQQNRFFIAGDPAAVLMVEFMCHTEEALKAQTDAFINEVKAQGLGYAYPLLRGAEINPAWNLRKSGLGLLRNIKGDAQPVNLIEDCAVDPEYLPDYIADLQEVLRSMNLQASYYAHAGAGELHVEPLINLKSSEGKIIFRSLLAKTAAIVKKYKGSLSGEHGDGRLRGEFIRFMLGEHCYRLCKTVKQIFDPSNMLNPGKIVDPPPMDQSFRFKEPARGPKVKTHFDFSEEGGILALAEKCSGSGDCRKTHFAGGTMCPSYMATRFERDTTRARANVLRQFLAQDNTAKAFDHDEIHEAMDLCLSCKGCKSECPSSVDVSKLKAEFLQQYYDQHGIPLKARMIAEFPRLTKLASAMPRLFNFAIANKYTGGLLKRVMNMAPEREVPALHAFTLRSWYRRFRREKKGMEYTGKVYLFCDEFTNYNDVGIGMRCIELLTALGYEVVIPDHQESGRTHLSKGLVKRAKAIAAKNVEQLAFIADGPYPLIGLEPSAILTFRDEYVDLVPAALKDKARALAGKVMLFEEFMAAEMDAGRISKERFRTEKREVVIHGHCHQKALSSVNFIKKVLSFPEHYEASVIASGCCGMAGSFGFDREHYSTSMQIGELVLFPAVRKQAEDVIIAAPGTSCRHQIKDGTGREALHPAEVLWEALV
ncbi:FAD-binding and (Fe-S)-binding domain-containing protein [Chitinophaga sp. XS-30]|uniref:FAD-binding and (Fe-S)-binding domain-containing protein n=1 Tax=Chitinophaga sp. XS-30 TaxID=2604421 RepID=UPI0011DE23ED|nr:FAD-binding and (Fe-S)-binding domain-containing protein [Chitinophaga sp. XS-30]QEH41624.1 FAD-binding protein [Chitinophaga sp. XS-30]